MAKEAEKLEPCPDCAMTGFSYKVGRGVWTMQPEEKICPACDGRGWRRLTKAAEETEEHNEPY